MNSSLPSLASQPRAFPMPTIAEDTLQYTLHLPAHLEPSSTALLVTEFVQSYLPTPWMWNKDGWELKIAADSSERAQRGLGGKLEGRMRVGDAVDDEWLVVWLLREISRKWEDIVMSIRDTDGEFLLIEAANELPQWVSPENAENRLWLSGGHLHLLPLHVRSSGSSARHIPDDEAEERQFDPEAYISQEDAVRAVRLGKFTADKGLEGAVWERIGHYPAKLSEHLHRAKAYLPIPIARALSIDPSLIQRAVEGFYVRDPAQLRAAARMAHFPPAPSILAPVTMTRAAYAQLQGQVFHPPRIFGPEWSVREDGDGNERRWRDLGVKIATGFEIMYREGGRRRSGTANSHQTVQGEKGYKEYIDQLKKAGFFGTELEGSEKWKEREGKARKGWSEIRSDDTKEHRPAFAYLVDTALESTKSLDPSTLASTADAKEDSEAWLEVSPDELDGMMMRASGQDKASGKQKAKEGEKEDRAEPTEEHGRALQDLAKKVQTFVGGEGDLQGARFADELSDDDMEDDDDDDNDGMDEEDQWQSLTPAQKEERMRSLVAPLEEGEWGKKDDDPNDDIVMLGSAPPFAAPQIQVPQAGSSMMRPPVLSKQEFDGVIDESDSEDDEDDVLPLPGTLGRQIAEMRWADTAPRIEEVEDEDDLDNKRDRSVRWDEGIDQAMHRKVREDHKREKGEEKPVIVNENEAGIDEGEDVDMADEQDAFLRFAREALGVDEEMWAGIVKNREDRGAFVPKISSKKSSDSPAATAKSPEGPPIQVTPPQDGHPNMTLNSFDTVMAAMDAELARAKGQTAKPSPAPAVAKAKPKPAAIPKKTTISSTPLPGPKSKGPLPKLPTEADLDAMSEEDLIAMDRELRAALKGAGIEDDEDDDDDLDPDLDPEEVRDLDGEGKMEYKMMRDLLESYKSQAGESGVVGNLFGRLGEK